MKEIDSSLENKIRLTYRLLSRKYHVKEQTVASIVCDYFDWAEMYVVPPVAVRKLRNPQPYGKIIEITTPIRFYWSANGEYGGAEMGPFFGGLTRYQSRLLEDILDIQSIAMRKNRDAKGSIPQAFKRAFEEKDA